MEISSCSKFIYILFVLLFYFDVVLKIWYSHENLSLLALGYMYYYNNKKEKSYQDDIYNGIKYM